MFDIGNTLREARLRRGLDIADCESATKIRAKYLRALEEEQFEILPGGTYVKSFLRTYAEHLDLDGRLVVEEYESRFDRRRDTGPDSEVARRRRARGRSREGRLLVLTSSLVMLAAVGVWAGFGGDNAPPPAPEFTTILQSSGTTPTYVEVRERGPDGRPLVTPAPIAPGRSQTVVSRTSIWVHLGEGPGVRLSVDGRNVIPPKGARDFLVSAGGRVQASTPAR